MQGTVVGAGDTLVTKYIKLGLKELTFWWEQLDVEIVLLTFSCYLLKCLH